MSWLYLINLFFVWFSWRVAQGCQQWSGAWWLNMIASSLNAVIVLNFVLRAYE